MAKLLKPSFSFVAVAFGPSSKIGVYPQKHAHSQLGLDLRHKRPAAKRGKAASHNAVKGRISAIEAGGMIFALISRAAPRI